MNFDIKYIDDFGDKQLFFTSAPSIKAAMAKAHDTCPDCRRIISCIGKPVKN